MRRTAILRFSDAEAATVKGHQEIIQAHGATWWGWWKKRGEPFRPPLLVYLRDAARRERVRIGLVNRKGAERFAVAACVDVAFTDGAAIGSPDPLLTPEYYRGEAFPAWFKFTRIEDVPKTSFIREFGGVPSLDPTLYEVFEDAGQLAMNPRPDWTMEPIETPGDTILHLSDLHFGDDYGFPLKQRIGEGIDQPPLPELLAARILNDLGLRIGTVVVSGDLITRGDANAYPIGEMFLTRLLQALELEREHCVIVPGNHDLWTLEIDHPTRDYAHEAPYRQFVRAFFGTEFLGLERVRRYRTRALDDLIFIELNSSRVRSDDLKEYGYVSKHRYELLLRWIKDSLREDAPPSGRSVLFAVLHHHILPVWAVSIPDEKRPVSLCLDAGELIDQFQKYGVRFVLHGHQHFPFMGAVSRAPTGTDVTWSRDAESVFVLGCGSSGARAEKLPRDLDRGVFGNIFGLYTITGNTLRAQFEQYTELQPPSTLWRLELPIS